MSHPLLLESVWLQQQKFEDAELLFRQSNDDGTPLNGQKLLNPISSELAHVRQEIQNVLNRQTVPSKAVGTDADVLRRIEALELENKELRKITDDLRSTILTIQASIQGTTPVSAPSPVAQPTSQTPQKPAPVPQAADDDDDDCDLFGSDDEEAKALKEKRLKEYAEKKSKKPGPIAKSSVVLDVKPWDDETDMTEVEKRVRTIEVDGLVWGAAKLVPVGYGIKKLSIICVVEDDKVSIDDLSERITTENEDLVQSVDVAAFNKI